MFGVSGDEKVSGPPMSGALANEPGLVPWARLDGLWAPRNGNFTTSVFSAGTDIGLSSRGRGRVEE
jgi:hypothetical protein